MSSRSWLLALRVAVLALACLLAIGLLAPVGCTGVTTSALLPDMGMQNETSYTQPEPESYALNVTVVGPGSVVEQTSYGTRALQDTYDAWENVRLRAEPDEDARFVRWEGDYGDTDEYLWVYMNGVQTVRAIFEVVIREADVSTWVDPDESGAISVAPAPPYTEGTTVTLTARPEVNWRFRHWNHNESSANPITVVLEEGNNSFGAYFEQIREADVSTWVNPDESGAISVAPAPPYTEGTTVTLTARPEVNWRFRHWNHNESSANPITVVLEEGNNSFGAYFEQLYTLSLASDPPAGGTILVDPPSGPYANDETVTLTAQPAAGFRFARWTGDAGGSTNPRTLSFSRANRSVTAVFEIPPPSVKSLGYETRPPFVVRFHMRLHDGDGHAISEGVTREMFSISENSQMLDYRETNQFVRPGPDLPLKVVLVLDYTASMKDAGAIDDMVVVAKSLIRAGDIDTGQPYFTATHHIGIVEFHDRPDDGFGEAMPLTRADEQGKNDLVAGVPAEDSVEHGLTRVWDAVDLAINMLRDTNRESGEVWAIVFLTDGYDTTSSTSANSIRSRAQSYDITLYPIGFGDVKPEHREAMQSMATNTGGLYSEASDAQALYEAFAQVVEELRGQWNLTYITQRNSGTVNATVTFAWQSGTTSFSKSFSASSLEGDIHQGEIDVIDRSYDEQANQTTFYLKATYVPRNISRFRFLLGQDGAAFTTQGHGGLLQGWTLNTPQSGVVELYAPGWPDDPIPLEYGSFGNIGWVTVPGDVAMLKLDYDQTVYDDLPHEKTMKLGGEYLAP